MGLRTHPSQRIPGRTLPPDHAIAEATRDANSMAAASRPIEDEPTIPGCPPNPLSATGFTSFADCGLMRNVGGA